MKSGVIALLLTKWQSSLLRYDTGTLFFYISSNKTDTNNCIFSPNVTQKNLVEVFRYVKTQHN